jgi:hypothetical protein
MTESNQEPVTLSKVKSILFKPESGLVTTKSLLNPILVGTDLETGSDLIVSGRHRLVALDLCAQALGVDTEEVKVRCVVLKFDNLKQLSLAMVACNTNRVMNRTERNDLLLTGKTGSLGLFERVSNLTTLKRSFGIELADTVLQNYPECRILRNSLNTVFTAWLGRLNINYPDLVRALIVPDEACFAKAMDLVYIIVERAAKRGLFEWDGKGNFQRTLFHNLVKELDLEATEVLGSLALQSLVVQPEQPKKPAKKRAKKDEHTTPIETEVARPVSTEQQSLGAEELSEW